MTEKELAIEIELCRGHLRRLGQTNVYGASIEQRANLRIATKNVGTKYVTLLKEFEEANGGR